MKDYSIERKRLWAENAPWEDRVDFVLFERVSQNAVAYSTRIEMYEPSPQEMGRQIDPTFSLNRDETQTLMDNLWRLGFRPSEGTGSAGALAAVEKHLEDMRKIAFDMLEKHEH